MKALFLLSCLALAADPLPPDAPPAEPEEILPITFDPAPVVGKESVVVVVDEFGAVMPGETVQVVHRPGLDGERQMAIGITDSLGRVRWKPEMAGVARVRAGDEEVAVGIGWTSIPVPAATLIGLLVLSSVGATVFGLLPKRGRARG